MTRPAKAPDRRRKIPKQAPSARAAILAALICVPILAAEPGRKEPTDLLAEFPIDKGGRHLILIPVKVTGKEYLFALDTGASITSFDLSLRTLLGNPVKPGTMDTAGGTIPIEGFYAPESYVGPLALHQSGLVSCLDLEMLRRIQGRDIRGVIGMDFLKNYILHINFDLGRLQFRRWTGEPDRDWGNPVYLYEIAQRDTPHVKVKLPGVGTIPVMVDLGASDSVCLTDSLFEKTVGSQTIAEALWLTGAGTIRSRVARIDSFPLGQFHHQRLVLSQGRHNLIGLGVLARYVVTFDFPSMKLYLRQGQAFDRPDDADMSGLHLWRLEGHTTVHSLDQGSPAELAGIEAGDVILKVGDRPASEIDLENLRDLFKSGDGKEFPLTLRRGKEEKLVRIKLKKRI